ncbi:iron ABC transporter permease [Weissella confusa]|uniref:FecCD family ABC transporter permease n=2 Tax=Weissella confusa TaxID=1583 RepID=UPI000715DC1A|nr:iron chelate uptake ABC transporter family permease subunit [Weissella confusa]KRN24404.1 transporter permease [Weissella confusa]MBJ7628535.1 iron ABC transporter permease [Weissella confusa]MBJ7698209.1 iron ABC transporter permease [Weissella confusa]MBS7550321.1 iron ABC transporter permease [Weissella confusa]MCQ8096161.1 iron ABC transporter permease [Weissella confusa]
MPMKHLYNWLLLSLLIISVIIALMVGSTDLPAFSNSEVWHLIITYRLPRIIVSIIGGAIIGASGLLLQLVLRNRFVDASILGMMNGSQFFTTGLLVLVPSVLANNVIFGALAGIIIMIGWRLVMPTNRGNLQLILIGIATAMTFQAGTSIASEGFGLPLPTLSTVTWLQVIQLTISVLVGSILLLLVWHHLKYFALSSQQVRLLGINESRTMWFVLIAIGIWIGALTSLIGVVFFLGAILPQIARLMAPKAKTQQLIVSTALWGSLLLLNADTIARTVLAPKELSTSAVLLAISGPLFVLMLIRGSRHA